MKKAAGERERGGRERRRERKRARKLKKKTFSLSLGGGEQRAKRRKTLFLLVALEKKLASLNSHPSGNADIHVRCRWHLGNGKVSRN